MKTNREEFTDFMKRVRLKKGESVVAFRKKQMIMNWKNKTDVILDSTFHYDSMEDVTARQGVIQKPSVVLELKKTLGESAGMLANFKVASCLENVYRSTTRRCSVISSMWSG
jgi:hypothetical protein